ncbi:viroplasmin family protein [Selenomonas noxia]|uniref:ribonuclease H1 domain-containing protein n=1 Tax=Selenomonas noxia TaxID=135083 RepID=UPI0028D0983C|nr:viroplasmin family protein [Selenomonas noxia]
MGKYYGVYNDRGAGIYSEWGNVKKAECYIGALRVKKFPVVSEAVGFVREGLRRECGISLEDRAGDMFAQRKNFFFHIEELPTKSYFTNRGIEVVRRER